MRSELIVINADSSISYRLLPTLQHVAAVKLAANMWRSQHAAKIFLQLLTEEERRLKQYIKSVFSRLKDQINELILPDKFRIFLIWVLRSLGIELHKWAQSQLTIDPLFQPFEFLHCIVWSSRGRINDRETAAAIIKENSGFNVYDTVATKFYYLNMDIPRHLFDPLVQTNPLSPIYNSEFSDNDFDDHFNYNDKFYGVFMVTDDTVSSADEYLISIDSDDQNYAQKSLTGLNRLTKYSNEFLFKRIWEELPKGTRTAYLNAGFMECQNADIMCFLLSQMNAHQQMKIFRRRSKYIFMTLCTDWLWQDSFLPTLQLYFESMNAETFVILLKRMVYGIKTDIRRDTCKEFLISLLENAPFNLKMEVLTGPRLQQFCIVRNALLDLFTLDHIDIIEKILSFATSINKKSIPFSIIIKLIVRFLDVDEGDQWYLLERCVLFLLPTKPSLEKFFSVHNRTICNLFISKGRFEKAEQLLNLFLSGEQKIFDFKKQVPYDTSCLEYAHRFLFAGHFDLADNMLSWCFSDDKERIRKFKRNDLLWRNFPSCASMLLIPLIRKQDGMEALEGCLIWCYEGKEHIMTFRYELLQSRRLTRLCWNLLILKYFELADQLLDWCFSYSRELVDSFKQDFVLAASIEGFNATYFRLFGMRHYFKIDEAKQFVSWLNPSLEVIQEYKSFQVNYPYNANEENVFLALCNQEEELKMCPSI